MKHYTIRYIHYIPKAAPEYHIIANLDKFDFIRELDRINRSFGWGLREVWEIDENGEAQLLTKVEIMLTRKFLRQIQLDFLKKIGSPFCVSMFQK